MAQDVTPKTGNASVQMYAVLGERGGKTEEEKGHVKQRKGKRRRNNQMNTPDTYADEYDQSTLFEGQGIRPQCIAQE